jgi:hypothetical protein
MFDMTAPPASIPLDTPDDVRAFLRDCLHRDGRTPNTPRSLHMVMPNWLRIALHAHAPHLAALLADANRLHDAENAVHDTYAHALADWIADVPTAPQTPADDTAADEATIDVLTDTIEKFFREVDPDTFENDDLAHTLLRAMQDAGIPPTPRP